MKKQLTLLILMAMLIVPTMTMAMKPMNNGSMGKNGGMSMGGNMVMLPDTTVEGVTAAAHLMDVKAKMAQHGMTTTHHLMVGFMDQSKQMVKTGQVALRIEGPDGKVGKTIKLMDMSGQFGGDITLDQTGKYKFMIGTKLADGIKRVFVIPYENK